MKIKKQLESKDEFRECYEKWATNYDENRSGNYEGSRVDSLQQNFVRKNLKAKKGSKIIECGCGTGRILLSLAKDYDCYGIDPAKNMLKVIKKNANKSKLKVKVREGDIEKIPFKSNTFDGVFSIHVLMHMKNIKKAIKEMHRIAKPGARIIFDLPNLDSPWSKLSILLSPNKKRTSLYKLSEVKKLLSEYDSEIHGLFSYPRTLYRIPVVKYITTFLDDNILLPIKWRTQMMIIIRKK